MNSPGTDKASNTVAEVIVVVDVHSQLSAPLEIAIPMATARRATLRGLCVEDLDLWQVASLPFAQEVMLLGGRARALEDRQLHRAMHSFAEKFKRLMAEQAERSSLPWSVSTVRGRKQTMELGEASPSSILVIGQPAPSRRSQQGPAKLLVLATAPEEILPALEVVLKHNIDRGVEIILATVDEKSSAQALLAKRLQTYPNVRVTSVSAQGLPLLFAALAPKIDYVIGSRQQDKFLLTQVLQLAACPVILVGAL